ncbi:MAG: hypothetical protein R8K50_03570 [Mariprofundus sp.]
MALPISPADGFISRLLQQTRQTAPAKVASGSQAPASKPDQASISPEARQAMQGTSQQHMESKLMDLYNQKGGRS